MGVKRLIVGTAVTLVIGGSAYTVNKADVINNFANDTGLTQQQAENYVNNVDQSTLVPYSKLGSSFIDDGNAILSTASKIDCNNYTYDWETTTLTCGIGLYQLTELGNDEISLGNSYIKLSTDNASRIDISTTVGLIDEVNSDFDFEIVNKLLDSSLILDNKNTNSYNKATLKAALQSN